jgi:hypothetical protein
LLERTTEVSMTADVESGTITAGTLRIDVFAQLFALKPVF